MDEAMTLKTLDQLIQLDTQAIQTYDLALKTVTDPAIRTRLEKLKAQHTHHAEQLSRDITKMVHNQIATHWDAITCAALEEQQSESVSQMRIVSGG